MAYNAMVDPDTGKFYHTDCAPDILGLEPEDVDGLVCEGCGGLIEQEDESQGDSDITTINPDEER